MKIFVLVVALIMFFGALFIKSSIKNGVTHKQKPQVLAESTIATTGDSLLDAVNDYRIQNGLQSLRISTQIKQLTDYRVSDMAINQYYSHKFPNGDNYASLIKNYEPDSMSSCENLQLQNSNDINQAVIAWSKSLSHKDCLLNPKLNVGAVSVAFFDDINISTDGSETSYVFAFIGSN